MCRLFGFRSISLSQVHRSLVGAENALVWQSERHPDGWGVAYYVDDFPHLIKSSSSAIHDTLFRKVSGIVSSHTVIAHLRKATRGECSLINTHPFQFGSWIFAHNGDIPNFKELRGALHARLEPTLRRFILGDTDSEVLFYLILSKLSQELGNDINALQQRDIQLEAVVAAIQKTVELVEEICGRSCLLAPGEDEKTERPLLSFLLTNGSLMLGHQGGKELRYSTHKVCCPERDTCKSFAPFCEAPVHRGRVNHAIFSSEVLHGENVWFPMKPKQIIAVNAQMNLERF